MKLNNDNIKIANLESGYWFCVKLRNDQLEPLNKILNNDKKETVIDVSDAKVKRSLAANAYCHTLIEKIAKLLTSTHDEIYEQALRDYGVHVYSVVLPKDIADKKKDYKFVDPMNKVKVQSDKGLIDAIQIDCIRGSSKYDSLQMSQFIEGIKTDCLDLGIEVLPPQEIERLIKMIGE